jgi:hypothetical protein
MIRLHDSPNGDNLSRRLVQPLCYVGYTYSILIGFQAVLLLFQYGPFTGDEIISAPIDANAIAELYPRMRSL